MKTIWSSLFKAKITWIVSSTWHLNISRIFMKTTFSAIYSIFPAHIMSTKNKWRLLIFSRILIEKQFNSDKGVMFFSLDKILWKCTVVLTSKFYRVQYCASVFSVLSQISIIYVRRKKAKKSFDLMNRYSTLL